MRQIKKRTLFIRERESIYYVPRPSSWLSGWARHLWFESHMGVKPNVASTALWAVLSERYAVRALSEDEEGCIEVSLSVVGERGMKRDVRASDQ